MQSTEGSLSHSSCIDTIYESDLDDENFSGAETSGIRERRRKLHTEAEQRRRNAIKKGFEALLELVHPIKSDQSSPAIRMSKSTILDRSINMIIKLSKQAKKKKLEMENLEKEVKALRILSMNYEKIAHTNSIHNSKSVEPVMEDTKLLVFQMFADALFTSFENTIALASFTDMSGAVMKWIEENCAPENLSSLMNSALTYTLSSNSEAVSTGGVTGSARSKRPVFNLPSDYNCYDVPDAYCIMPQLSQAHSIPMTFSVNTLPHKPTYSYDLDDFKSRTVNIVPDVNTGCTEQRSELKPSAMSMTNFPASDSDFSNLSCPPNLIMSDRMFADVGFQSDLTSGALNNNTFSGPCNYLLNHKKTTTHLNSILNESRSNESSLSLTSGLSNDGSSLSKEILLPDGTQDQYNRFMKDM